MYGIDTNTSPKHRTFKQRTKYGFDFFSTENTSVKLDWKSCTYVVGCLLSEWLGGRECRKGVKNKARQLSMR